MSTNDSCSMAVFKWLATILSFAIALPAVFYESTQIAFILTACVFIFCKFVDNLEGVIKNEGQKAMYGCLFGSFIGGISIGLCFYYFAAIFNVTEIVKIIGNDKKLESVNLASEVNMIKFPLFSNDFLFNLLLLVLIFYVMEETIACGCVFCKYFNTKRQILLSGKNIDKVLEVSTKK